jgi:hypothetical protein
MTHRVRIEAAGVTRRRITDREIGPKLATAVDLFHDAMDTWRAINDSTTPKTSHRKALVLDDRAVVEALLHAGWTPPEGQH